MSAKTERELALLVTGKDVSATRALANVNRQMLKTSQIAGKAGSNISRNLQRGVVIGAAASVGAIGYAIKAAMDWESAIAGVAKTVDGDISGIAAGLREMATEIPTEGGAAGLAAIAEAAGALGVAKDDILGFTKTVALLDVTTDLTADAAGTALGKLATNLKLTGDDFGHVGSTLVDLGNKGASTESEILSMAEGVSGAAGIMGATTPQILGWAAALANTGEEAEAGGSSIQRFWLESMKSVNKGGKELKLMAKISGQTTAAFKKDFGKDATSTLAKFITKLGKLTKAEQLATLEALGFTDIRITRGLLKLLGNTDNLTDSLTTSADAWEDNTAMTVEAEKRFKTTASQVALLRQNFDEAAMVVGAELLPVIRDLSKEGVDWLKGHQPEIAAFAKDLGKGIREAVTWAQKLDWDAIGGGLEMAAGGAREISKMFMGLPDWVKTAVITGWGLNKFTGGAVVDFGKLVFARGANPAMPMYVAVVGGMPGGGLVPAGGKGGLPGLGTIGAITIAAFAPLAIAQMAGAPELVPETVLKGGGYGGRGGGNPLRPWEQNVIGGGTGGAVAGRSTGGLSPADREELRVIARTVKAESRYMDLAENKRVRGMTDVIAAASRAAGQQAAFAIRDKDLSVTFAPTINVSTKIDSRAVAHALVKYNLTGGRSGHQR